MQFFRSINKHGKKYCKNAKNKGWEPLSYVNHILFRQLFHYSRKLKHERPVHAKDSKSTFSLDCCTVSNGIKAKRHS
jgi:hypothetical protein